MNTHAFKKGIALAVACAWFVSLCAPANAGEAARHTFSIGENDFLLDGQRFQIRCGEIHAARVPREYWRHRLQMAKAMGLNTVCAYLFWNMHEPLPGQFNWSDRADIAEFCRLAQQEGLWVILRPGPYACAEWEMGGFPWWLLKHEDIKLRTRDARYMEPAKRYLKEVGRVLGPLQVTKGGPILMVQVENEYGFFGRDAEYMGDLRQALLDAGFDVPLFACNPTSQLRSGYRADLFPVVNFGSDPERNFRALRQILPKGPLMCGEFYPGWFDTWGAPHHTGNTARYLADLEYMLKAGASFSIYMAHGGTTFGFGTGADRPFKPDTSSYDYDAPISEAGWTTDKFFKTREVFGKYLLPSETIPEPPANNPVISFPPNVSYEHALLLKNLPAAVVSEKPLTFEAMDQAHGCILYRTTLPAGPACVLEAAAVHDFGFVFLDGKRLGVFDRRSRNFKLQLGARTNASQIEILVEAMGRVNFGAEVHDRKGLHGPVKWTAGSHTAELTNWQIFSLPLDEKMIAGLKDYSVIGTSAGPGFWRIAVNLTKTGDTFLDMRKWGKGIAWVNGRNLGRYWNIGPQQTMYVPGPWLKTGRNEFIILDLTGPEESERRMQVQSEETTLLYRHHEAVIAGLEQPILNQLRPELDFARARRPDAQLTLNVKPAVDAEFRPGIELQSVTFTNAVTGRYFCLESLSALDGKAFAAIAELDLLDETGKPLSHEGWTIAMVDSEERGQEDGTAENAIDGQTANFWHTEWGAKQPPHPHRLVLDLGQTRRISGFQYTPRQGAGDVGGRIKGYRVYVGDDLVKK